ncbi:hypothetical protein GCM10007968_16700 [Sporolactobacillus putidus]|uniref:Uncharacterized protein n=1 Tax=Sporolactobacillus putidus TaxID=492735 RepID=A0A917S3Q9_9BACL|nr:anti-sigma factor domain-containing protein [Sporolactobacillus putidus]GGL53302.1 hypothetical protein GCM10007968_16700 [Sporolactobacillus putidus]
MSREGRHAILLTNEGDFRSVKLRRSADISIGQTVLSRHLSHTFKICKFFLTSVVTVSMSFLCLLPFSQSTDVADRPVAAYLDFDLAPSIEATVDQSFRVISVRPLNEDAKKVIPDPDFFSDMSLKKFSSILVTRLNEKGYLNSGSLYLITAVLTGRVSHSHRDAFDAGLIQAVKSGSSQLVQSSGVSLRWLHASLDGRTEAIKNRVSTGRYLLSRQANSLGKSLRPRETGPGSEAGEDNLLFVNPWSRPMKVNSSNRTQGDTIRKILLSSPEIIPLDLNPFKTREKAGNPVSSSYRLGNAAAKLWKVPVSIQA